MDKTKLRKRIKVTTVSLEEFSKNFTLEQNRIVEDEVNLLTILEKKLHKLQATTSK